MAIVGDVLHSRVARSQIHALTTLGVPEVRVIGPKTLLPTGVEQMGVKVFHDMETGLKGCDVIIMLRLQNERMKGALLPSAQEYFKFFGLTPEKLALAKPDAIVMHPGPMNRGVEIDSAVADGPQSVILPQVTYGIAVRMAVMALLAGRATHEDPYQERPRDRPDERARRSHRRVYRRRQNRRHRPARRPTSTPTARSTPAA